MKIGRRRYEGALAALAVGVLMTAACNRLPPGGLFAPGAVDEVVFAARRLDYLQRATGNGSGGGPLNAVAQMAREEQEPGYIATPGSFGPNAWDGIFTKLSTFEDTSDFDALYLLNALLGYRDNPAVDPVLWQKTEDALLAFKFWYTQPTPTGIIDDMWYWSENHQIIFHTLEYLAGQTFPDRVFTTTGMTGVEHQEHARVLIESWLAHKARFGFDEWHSNVYYQKDVTPLLTLVEYAQDPQIAAGAAMLLDRFLLDIALNSFKGTFGATHGRSYKKDKMSALDEDTYALTKFLFDTSELPYNGGAEPGATLLARAKKYRLPQVILDIARSETPFVNRERMGIPINEFAPLTADASGQVLIDESGAIPPPPGPYGLDFRDEANLPIFWSMGALTVWQMLPMVYQVADTYGLWETQLFQPFLEIRDAVGTLAFAQVTAQSLPHAAAAGLNEQVNTYSFRTPDYLLSSAQDYRKGSRGNQYHSWQATFGANALVFTTHPGIPPRQTLDWNNDGEPGSWTGTASQPRTAQHENVAIHLYSPQYAVVASGPLKALTRYEPYTHAYFPQDHFDEVVRDGHWTFGRHGSGYIALYSWRMAEFVDHGPNVAKNGMTLPFDLVASGGPDDVWIAECGSESQWGSFAAFQTAVHDAAVIVTPGTTGPPSKTRPTFLDITYQSPSQGAMQFSWTGPLVVRGETVPITDYPRMDNPWTHVEFEDRDLFVEDPANGTALWQVFGNRRRMLFRVE